MKQTAEGVKYVMGGRILPLPSDPIREWIAIGEARGVAIGEARGEARGIEKGFQKSFMETLQTMYAEKFSVSLMARITRRTEDAVIQGLLAQGLSPL